MNYLNVNQNKVISKRIFCVIDVNNDGLIDFFEFMDYSALILTGDEEEGIKFLFKLICNGDRNI